MDVGRLGILNSPPGLFQQGVDLFAGFLLRCGRHLGLRREASTSFTPHSVKNVVKTNGWDEANKTENGGKVKHRHPESF
jgi:hypothetical protein